MCLLGRDGPEEAIEMGYPLQSLALNQRLRREMRCTCRFSSKEARRAEFRFGSERCPRSDQRNKQREIRAPGSPLFFVESFARERAVRDTMPRACHGHGSDVLPEAAAALYSEELADVRHFFPGI